MQFMTCARMFTVALFITEKKATNKWSIKEMFSKSQYILIRDNNIM